MGDNTKIEWATHTFNPWIGCQKVGPGCDHCYAEAMMADRYGRVEWGPHGCRQRTSPANWKKPLAWDRAAAKAGRRDRVFCASLADVFDNHPSVLPEWREDLWRLIEHTPNLDWLLLTKRPGNIGNMLPVPFDFDKHYPNVWLGCTVVNQAEADRDIPKLLAVPATVRFLSMEPLLGPVDLTRVGSLDSVRLAFPDLVQSLSQHMRPHVINGVQIEALGRRDQAVTYYQTPDHMGGFEVGPRRYPRLDWVICGGESGPGARPMHPDWARSLRDQCVAARVPFFFKQWGEWGPRRAADQSELLDARKALIVKPDGSVTSGLMAYGNDAWVVDRVGKARAGRLLDGRTWDQLPGVHHD